MPTRIIIAGIAAGLFASTVVVANYLIQNVGTVCVVPNGPCLIPVGFGLSAPSGVLMIGVAFVLRDIVHRLGGVWLALMAVCVGAAVSLFVAPPALALASAAAFLLSELADTLVYSPLYRRRLISAVVASSVVGAIVDSAVFLYLAFGSLDYLAGQVVGKMWAAAVAVIAILLYRAWRKRHAVAT